MIVPKYAAVPKFYFSDAIDFTEYVIPDVEEEKELLINAFEKIFARYCSVKID